MDDASLGSIIALTVLALVLAIALHYFLQQGKDSVVMKEALHIPQNELSLYKQENKPFVTCDGTALSPIRYALAGSASIKETPPRTVIHVFHDAVQNHAGKDAMRVERPVPPLGADKKCPPALPTSEWKTWCWQDYFDECFEVACSLYQIGIVQHDSVCVYGFNSPEWFMAWHAAIMAAAKVVGIYPSDTVQQLHYKMKHSGARVVFIENEEKLEKLKKAIEMGLPKLMAIVMWDGAFENPLNGVACYNWDAFIDYGQEVDGRTMRDLWDKIEPGHCCTLIYTSGTTGNPKAVMISHDNLLFELSIILHVLTKHTRVNQYAEEERILSYLPLSHIAGLCVDLVFPLILTSDGVGWICTYFSRPYDLKVGTIGDRLRAAKPTIFFGVPRVWEKVAEKIKAIGATKSSSVRNLSGWCKRKLLAHQKNCQLGGSGRKDYGHTLANLVLRKVKEAIGLETCKFAFSGAAPIAVETLEYFGSLGIQINEVYGMSECTSAASWSVASCHVWGSCGWILPGVEMKVFRTDTGRNVECPPANELMHPTEEEQGELCFRGRTVMMGYLVNPDLGQEHVDLIKKQNNAAIDEEGWLHSGDKGCVDHRGMVRITGRYKELIIGSGGENIVPVPIEDNIKSLCPGISNFIMIGNQRKYNVALVTLKAKGATGEVAGTDELEGAALTVSEGIKTISGASRDNIWIKTITQAIINTNKNGLCCPSNASKIQKFTILPRDFSIEGGELTATLKTKRAVVHSKYATAIDSMYASTSKDVYVPYVSS